MARLVGLPADFPGRDLFGGSGEAHTGEPLYMETLLPVLRFREPEVRGLLDGPWKLIRHYEDGRRELYNLKDDLSETKDLAAKTPEKVKALDAKLTVWLKSVGAKMPKKNPDYKPAAKR